MNTLTTAQPPSWQRWIILLSMCLAVFTIAFTGTSIVNAMLVIRRDLQLNVNALPWLGNAYFLAAASLIIISGRASEIFGRRNMFVIGVIIFIVGSLIIACVHSAAWVIAARAIQGVGASIVTPGTLAIVKTRFPPEQQVFAASTWSTSIGFGFAIGPIIGGALTQVADWHYIFWLLALLFLISLVLFLAAKPKNIVPNNDHHIDVVGLILLLLCLVPLILGFSNGTSWGWKNHWVLGLLIWGGLFFFLLLFFEIVQKKPLVHFEFFKLRLFSLSAFGVFCALFTLMGTLYFINLYLQNPLLFNYSPLMSGVLLLPYSAGFFIASFFSSKIVKKLAYRWPLVFASLLSAGGFLWLCFIKPDTTYLFLWAPLIFLGLGSGFQFGVLPGIGMTSLSDKQANAASGLISTCLYVGAIFCTVLGSIFMLVIGHHNAIVALEKVAISVPEKYAIAHSVAGHYDTISRVLAPLSPTIKHQAMLIIERATVHSFVSVMILCGAVSLFLVLLVLVLIPWEGEG